MSTSQSNYEIHFGTDGWRAIIGEGFTVSNLVKVIDASAQAFKQKAQSGGVSSSNNVVYVGHDCRQDAHTYASVASEVLAANGFDVKLTQDYCPTPTLCWSVAHDDNAIGGVMLTSSHNPAEYLGVKLRMSDGGASPAEFTDVVEDIMARTDEAGGMTDKKVVELAQMSIEEARLKYGKTPFPTVDLMTPYLASLKQLVDVDAIRQANLHVVVDPLFGAGRGYLAGLLREMGVDVTEINNAEDPTFDGLHPEPIPPWVDRGLEKARELHADALFINDGDADRIGAGDCNGSFVNPHRIICLVTQHMVDRGATGRVVSTVTASALLDRLCRKLDLELVSTPVGFKWIYGEMERGGVMVGGEESGGIGLPNHVKERDGLLMALLLTEMMAQTGKDLSTLVSDMLAELGTMEFTRRGLSVTDNQMSVFREHTIPELEPADVCGTSVTGIDRRDGVKLMLEGDGWVMMRPSGTEPLVRIYAEASTQEEVNNLLNWAESIVCA